MDFIVTIISSTSILYIEVEYSSILCCMYLWEMRKLNSTLAVVLLAVLPIQTKIIILRGFQNNMHKLQFHNYIAIL